MKWALRNETPLPVHVTHCGESYGSFGEPFKEDARIEGWDGVVFVFSFCSCILVYFVVEEIDKDIKGVADY